MLRRLDNVSGKAENNRQGAEELAGRETPYQDSVDCREERQPEREVNV